MFSKLVSTLLLVSTVLSLCTGAVIYPKSLQTQKSASSDVALSALQTQDQSGTQDSWSKYVEFQGSSTAYEGIFTFDASAIDASSVGAYSLKVNFKGPVSTDQLWQFEFYEPASNTWLLAGDNEDAQSWTWTTLTFCGSVDFASLVADGNIQVRLSSAVGDDCDLDYLAITTSDSASDSSSTSSTATKAPNPTAASKPTKAPTSKPTKPTKAPTAAPTSKPAKPTKAPTAAPTSKPSNPTKAPTSTKAPTAAPTKAPTTKPTSKPSSGSTSQSPSGRMCPAGKIWSPAPGTTWQWQLTGTVDTSYDVQMYDIDLFDNDASTIATLQASGRAVICYFSTQYENWRPDAADFTAAVLGSNLDDWPGERYVDIRSSVVRTIIQNRLDLAVSKGCDGVEPDNVDEYTNTNGFGITAVDQLDFNKFIAQEAHARGLSVGLKNDLDQVKTLQPYFDWALNEQCNQYSECSDLTAFVTAGKAVFGVEYSGSASKFCPTMVTDKFSWLLKDLDLDASVTPCCTYATGGCAAKASYTCASPSSKRAVEEEEALASPAEVSPMEAEETYPASAGSAVSVALPVVVISLIAAVLVL